MTNILRYVPNIILLWIVAIAAYRIEERLIQIRSPLCQGILGALIILVIF